MTIAAIAPPLKPPETRIETGILTLDQSLYAAKLAF